MSERRVRKIVAPEATQKANQIVTLVDAPESERSDENTPAHRRALDRAEERKELISLPDQVAGDPLHFRNYKWPGADQVYPDVVDARMRFVSRYYPHASKAPLYVDEPRTYRDLMKCHEKSKHLKKMKLRYIVVETNIITPEGESLPGSTLSDLLEQLGE